MAVKQLKGKDIKVSDVWITLRCPSCKAKPFRVQARGAAFRKVCPFCNGITFNIELSAAPGELHVDVVTVDNSMRQEPYELKSTDIEFDRE